MAKTLLASRAVDAGTPFMREVALIAVHRGISQAELARQCSKAGKRRLGSRNVSAHFTTTRLTAKVRAMYAKALGLRSRYVQLLATGKPVLTLTLLVDPIDRHLKPSVISPLFRKGAISKAVKIIGAETGLRDRCIYAAQLASERERAMPDSPVLPTLLIDPKVRRAARVPTSLIRAWAAVAEVLKPRVKLKSSLVPRSPELVRQEKLLLSIWGSLHVDANITWFDWPDVERVLTTLLQRKRLPVDVMLDRLHEDPDWQRFEEGSPDVSRTMFEAYLRAPANGRLKFVGSLRFPRERRRR